MSADALVDRVAERQYLGGVLLGGDLPVGGPVASDMSHPAHSAVLSACTALALRGEVVDPITVGTELGARGQLRLASRDLLTELTGEAAFQLAPLARRIRELAQLRAVRLTAAQVASTAEAGDLDGARELLEAALDLAQRQQGHRIGTLLEAGQAWLREVVAAETAETPRARFGWPYLDEKIGGLRPGTMHVVGGRSGCRKSSVLLAAAAHMARTGLRPGIVSLEDEESVWGERAALLGARIVSHMHPTHRTHAAIQAVPSLADVPIRLIYAIGSKPDGVVEASRTLLDHGVDVLIVDYLQAADFDAGVRRYDKAVASLAKRLKGLAFERRVPLLLGSQVTTPKGRELKEPHKSDLRESGDILIATESLLMLWKESHEPDATVHGRLAKLKWGPDGHRFQLDISPAGVVVGASQCEETSSRDGDVGYARY